MAKPFESERAKYLHLCKLDGEESKAVSDVEEFGCHILQVKGGEFSKGFSYTVGVYDTSSKPELIVVGLKNPTAQYLLNEAVSRMRAGVDLTVGRHDEMLGDVQCEFRPVDPKWVQHLMGWDGWYYGSWDFPVLQTIYPDLEGRFQNEPDFTEYFRQPLLQPGAAMTREENDLWAANNLESSLFDWKFPDPPHTSALVTLEVNSGREDVTFVNHLPDDEGWEFVGDTEGGDFSMVCLHHPIDTDPTLKELSDLPKGWNAARAARGAAWLRRPMNLED